MATTTTTAGMAAFQELVRPLLVRREKLGRVSERVVVAMRGECPRCNGPGTPCLDVMTRCGAAGRGTRQAPARSQNPETCRPFAPACAQPARGRRQRFLLR